MKLRGIASITRDAESCWCCACTGYGLVSLEGYRSKLIIRFPQEIAKELNGGSFQASPPSLQAAREVAGSAQRQPIWRNFTSGLRGVWSFCWVACAKYVMSDEQTTLTRIRFAVDNIQRSVTDKGAYPLTLRKLWCCPLRGAAKSRAAPSGSALLSNVDAVKLFKAIRAWFQDRRSWGPAQGWAGWWRRQEGPSRMKRSCILISFLTTRLLRFSRNSCRGRAKVDLCSARHGAPTWRHFQLCALPQH